MNRKVTTIIILVVFVLSLVIVSIIGTVGLDWSQNIIATEIYAADSNGNRLPLIDVGGKQMAQIEVELEALSNTYVFYYVIVPDKADNKRVEFVYPGMEDYISVTGSGGSAIITFKQGVVPEEGFTVTVKCLDGSEKSVAISFIKKQVDEGGTDL